jgi:hypothetical protein
MSDQTPNKKPNSDIHLTPSDELRKKGDATFLQHIDGQVAKQVGIIGSGYQKVVQVAEFKALALEMVEERDLAIARMTIEITRLRLTIEDLEAALAKKAAKDKKLLELLMKEE